MDLVDIFRASEYRAAIVHDCSKPGCRQPIKKHGASFLLTDAPSPHLLIDCDQPPVDQSKRHCDYLFVADGGGWVASIEMTSGKKRLADAREQLEAGATLVSRVVAGSGLSVFQPVLVGQLRDMDKQMWADIKKRPHMASIRFRGRWHRLKFIRSGERLAKALQHG